MYNSSLKDRTRTLCTSHCIESLLFHLKKVIDVFVKYKTKINFFQSLIFSLLVFCWHPKNSGGKPLHWKNWKPQAGLRAMFGWWQNNHGLLAEISSNIQLKPKSQTEPNFAFLVWWAWWVFTLCKFNYICGEIWLMGLKTMSGCQRIWENSLLLLWEVLSGAMQFSGHCQLHNKGNIFYFIFLSIYLYFHYISLVNNSVLFLETSLSGDFYGV